MRLRLTSAQEPLSFNFIQFAQFVVFTLFTCPPNFLWQEFLEEKFPGQRIQPDGSKQLDVPNTARKFFLDQTLGAVVNTAIFIGTFAALKGKDGPSIQRDIRRVRDRCLLRTGTYYAHRIHFR